VWVPWLLWNSNWVLAGVFSVFFFATGLLAVRLDPFFYFADAVCRGDTRWSNELAMLHGVRAKLSSPSPMDTITSENVAGAGLRQHSLSEVREAALILDELEGSFDSHAYRMVRAEIERTLLAAPDLLLTALEQNGKTVRQCILTRVANVAGDYVESGQFHIWRGALNPLGPGEDLLKLHDAIADDLSRLGAEELEVVQRTKTAIRERVMEVG
jgi:hypothetical protein